VSDGRSDRAAARLSTLACVALLAVVLAQPVAGGADEDLRAATDAYAKGDYATALKLLQPLAEAGNAGAQYGLGVLYRNGKGVARDLGEAVSWYRKSAEQGNPFAEYDLATMYGEGLGVAQSYPDALGWYRRAADQGDPRALYNLGVMYEKGQGTAADSAKAYMWYTLAAFRFERVDAQARARALVSRERVAGAMTPDQVAAAEKMAREWRPN
jgi:TPR repeat protein